MLKAVIFDIDDTLYSFADAHKQAMTPVCAYAERELGIKPENFCATYDRLLAFQLRYCGDTAGGHSRAIRFQLLLEERKLPLRHAAVMSDLYWNEVLRGMVPNPGVVEFISALKARGIRMGVGSDMTADWQLKKLDRLSILDDLDFVVTSEEAAVEKPGIRLFQLCAQKAGCRPEECLFIGDNLKKDVLGAQAAGMKALWFQPNAAEAAKVSNVKSIPTFQGLIDHITF